MVLDIGEGADGCLGDRYSASGSLFKYKNTFMYLTYLSDNGERITAEGKTPDENIEALMAKTGVTTMEGFRGRIVDNGMTRDELFGICEGRIPKISPKYAVKGINV